MPTEKTVQIIHSQKNAQFKKFLLQAESTVKTTLNARHKICQTFLNASLDYGLNNYQF